MNISNNIIAKTYKLENYKQYITKMLSIWKKIIVSETKYQKQKHI